VRGKGYFAGLKGSHHDGGGVGQDLDGLAAAIAKQMAFDYPVMNHLVSAFDENYSPI
jgi:hypothetical protein